MIVDLQQQFNSIYADIKRHHHTGSIVIMVAQDVDAACTYRILEVRCNSNFFDSYPYRSHVEQHDE